MAENAMLGEAGEWGDSGSLLDLSLPFLPGSLGAGAHSALCRGGFPFLSGVLGP